ncbi:helix-turn-helix transcriptional regulator [Rummeliibacillus sp. G93]|uniref:tetratricopeptide repeat protein n=1 Tax=Rummeliibacillus sp. G93 TaxID=2939494 RepID=UPI00201BB69E|nr:tetratricopeptide repeat protein [Rummeliibacillus sp. G93]UQW97655.1 helix-turn-helix transcriptional regulator [Rummeliibacillus sp. G93]
MLIGQNLRYYRKAKGFTQEQLAEDICHTTYISKIENSSIIPPNQTLSDLCRKLGITIEQLTQNIDEEQGLLLNNWLEQINKKNFVDKQYNHLNVVFQDVESPFLLSRYYTILLRYFILIKDKQEAEITSQKVKSFENYITSETEYDYNFSLGLFEYNYGGLNTAYTYFLKGEQILERKGVKDSELLYYMALTLSRSNKISSSTIYAYRALELYNKDLNFIRTVDCSLLLGINFNLMEDYDKAEEFFQKVINISGFHEHIELAKGRAYHNLGNIYSKQGKPDLAIDMLCKSLQFKKHTNNKTNTVYLLAREYFAIGEIEKGTEWLTKGMDLVKETKDTYYQLKLKVLYSRVNEGNSPQYFDLLKKSITYFKDIDLSFTRECAELLAKLQANKFLYKEAYEYLQLTINLMKSNKK